MKNMITGADYLIHPDEKDEQIMDERVRAFNKIDGPRVGDYIWLNGDPVRFTHDWGESIQTSMPGNSGSFYMDDGYVSFSGGLNPAIDKNKIELTPGSGLAGNFWFFHHDFWGASRAVYFRAECRVYKMK